MNIEVGEQHGVIILGLQGDLDLFSAEELKQHFREQVAQGVRKIVLDMGKIKYLDSMGVGSLLYMFAESKKQDVAFLIASMGGTPRKVIELTKLDRYFPLVESIEDAIQELG